MASKGWKKISKYEYYTKSRVFIESAIKMQTEFGRPVNNFKIEIPEYEIYESDDDVDRLQRTVNRLLEEKTSIQWKNYISISVEGITTAGLGHYNPMVKINFHVKKFKQGANCNGEIYNTFDGVNYRELKHRGILESI